MFPSLWTLILTNIVFNEFLVISNKISWSLHVGLWKLTYNPGLNNTTFSEFLIKSNKNIKFSPQILSWQAVSYFRALEFISNFWITEICRISDACSRSKLEFKTFLYKCPVVSNYIVVTLQLYIMKNGELDYCFLQIINRSLRWNEEQQHWK